MIRLDSINRFGHEIALVNKLQRCFLNGCTKDDAQHKHAVHRKLHHCASGWELWIDVRGGEFR